MERQVQHDQDQAQRQRDDVHQPVLGLLHFLEFAAPLGAVGGLEQRGGLGLRLGHGAGQVALAHAELDGDQPVALLAGNGRGAGRMKLPFGSGLPWSSSGVTRSPSRRRGLAQVVERCRRTRCRVSDGMATLVPGFDRPVLAPVSGVCGIAGRAGGDLVVRDVDRNVRGSPASLLRRSLGPAQRDVEASFRLRSSARTACRRRPFARRLRRRPR